MKLLSLVFSSVVFSLVTAQNCADPGQLPNGGRVPPPSSPAGYAPGEELFFFCDDGYTIEDKACITCGGTSGWLPHSKSQPGCVSNASAHKHVPDPHNCKCNIATGFFTCSSGPTPPPAPTPAPLDTFDCKLDPAGGFKCEVAQGKSGDYNSSSECEARCHVPTPKECFDKSLNLTLSDCREWKNAIAESPFFAPVCNEQTRDDPCSCKVIECAGDGERITGVVFDGIGTTTGRLGDMEGILRVLHGLDGITHLSFGEALGATPAVDGTIPYTLTSFPQLQSFYTGQNKGVHGTIPSECGQLSQLQSFTIGSTGINGTLPSELGGMTKLTYINIQCTHLTGTIPTELGRLVRLTEMYLGCGPNKLTGTIPTELGNLANLATMSLWNNALTGQIPAQLTQLPLTKLRLNGNQLFGTVPILNFALFANSTCDDVDSPGCCLSGKPSWPWPNSNSFSCPLPEGASLACHATCK
jgi:hypothetical protein